MKLTHVRLRLWAFFLLLLATTGAVCADPAIGILTKEVPDQIGVYQAEFEGETTLRPGDIVTVLRSGEKIGEATVMRVNGSTAVVSLKGVYEALSGDRVEFARSSAAPSLQPDSGKVEPSPPPRAQPLDPEPRGTQPKPNHSPIQQVCPSCKRGMRPTGKRKTEQLKTLAQYSCGSHKYWVVTGNLGPETRRTLPNQCPVCPFPLFPTGYKPGVGSVYKCQSGHEVVK